MIDILPNGVGWTDRTHLQPHRGSAILYVPLVEFTAGGAVIFGFLAPLAALGPLVLVLVAVVTSGPQQIKVYKPIDGSLEVLYAFMLIMVVSAGAGPYSLDALILGLINKHGA